MKKNRLSEFLTTSLNKLTQLRLTMNFAVFKQKYLDSENTKTAFMLLSVILGIVVIMQQYKINTMGERLVIVPPNLTKEAKLTHKTANRDYLNDMALYIATQISSTTPKSVNYVIGSMEGFFAPEIWASLKPQLIAIRDNPNFIGLSNPISQFTPTGGVIYEPETDKIFVVGELRTSAYGRQGKLETLGTLQAVYEMKLKMINGMPRVVEWYAYQGHPLTQEFRSKNATAYNKAMDERQVAYIPMVNDAAIQRESTQNTITMTLTQPQQPAQETTAQPQIETMQPSVPNVQQEQPVQAAPAQQQVLDPFASAEQNANQAVAQQPQTQQAVQQPAAPAVILPNGSVPNGLPQPATNTMPASMDDDKL
ncbi:MAG: hypothetical protein IKZ88_04345 [Neisseriaceae bacterium]|nr:hypothetical protein [Neisseriaceae bacterium]